MLTKWKRHQIVSRCPDKLSMYLQMQWTCSQLDSHASGQPKEHGQQLLPSFNPWA